MGRLSLSNPVFDLELRRLFRRRRTYVILVVYLAILSLGTWLTYTVLHGLRQQPGMAFIPVGKIMFATTFLLQLGWLCFFVPGLVAGSIAGERERQTLELLLATPLGPGRVVRGKFAAGFGLVGLFWLVALPLLSFSFLMGAVAVEEVLVATAMLGALALALCGVGLFASALARSSVVATIIANGLVFLGLVALPGLVAVVVLALGIGGAAGQLDRWGGIPVTVGTLLTLAGLHPLSAAVLTEVAWLNGLSLWWPEWSLGNLKVGTPGPWLVFCLTYALLGLGCVWAAGRRCRLS